MPTRCETPLPRSESTADAPRGEVRRSRATKWRVTALIAVHVAIAAHVAHWWSTGRTLTPLEPSEGIELSSRGVLNAGAIFFAMLILSTALLGRWFCGWACHVVALQDLCRGMLVKIGIRDELGTDRAITELMGKDTQARYMFIMERAAEAEALDV